MRFSWVVCYFQPSNPIDFEDKGNYHPPSMLVLMKFKNKNMTVKQVIFMSSESFL